LSVLRTFGDNSGTICGRAILVTSALKLKRPTSSGRCIHCRAESVEQTKDHVFPSSWYPDSTPDETQRWTVPSCRCCNEKFGKLEKSLLIRLGLCIDPRKAAAMGLAERALRSLGIRAQGISAADKLHREALKGKILGELRPFRQDMKAHVLPGLGPHPEFPQEQQLALTISAEDVIAVLKKIIRGCEYWFEGGRIIEEPPWEISIHFVQAGDVPDPVRLAITPAVPVHLGPGLRIQRRAADDGSKAIVYRVEFWDALPAYAIILPPEEP
jgi:hypothetical protein